MVDLDPLCPPSHVEYAGDNDLKMKAKDKSWGPQARSEQLSISFPEASGSPDRPHVLLRNKLRETVVYFKATPNIYGVGRIMYKHNLQSKASLHGW